MRTWKLSLSEKPLRSLDVWMSILLAAVAVYGALRLLLKSLSDHSVAVESSPLWLGLLMMLIFGVMTAKEFRTKRDVTSSATSESKWFPKFFATTAFVTAGVYVLLAVS